MGEKMPQPTSKEKIRWIRFQGKALNDLAAAGIAILAIYSAQTFGKQIVDQRIQYQEWKKEKEKMAKATPASGVSGRDSKYIRMEIKKHDGTIGYIEVPAYQLGNLTLSAPVSSSESPRKAK